MSSRARTQSVLVLGTAQGLQEIFKMQAYSNQDKAGLTKKHAMSVRSAYGVSLGSVLYDVEEKGETLLPSPLDRNVHKESYTHLAEASLFGAPLRGMVSLPF